VLAGLLPMAESGGPMVSGRRTANKYAALLLLACEPVRVVSQRLGALRQW
jgi:hypothetical protein